VNAIVYVRGHDSIDGTKGTQFHAIKSRASRMPKLSSSNQEIGRLLGATGQHSFDIGVNRTTGSATTKAKTALS
jgi:hypothetical protein